MFAGISDDGRLAAFIAEPTFSCRVYDCTPTGPTRMFLRNLVTGELINLDSQVRLTSGQGQVDGNALLSPDGNSLAFSTRAPYPELGDGNTNRSDVFVLNLVTNTVHMASTDANGQQLTIKGFAPTAGGPTYAVQSFLSDSTRVAFRSGAALNVGPASVYAKSLVTGALDRLLPAGFSVGLSQRQRRRRLSSRPEFFRRRTQGGLRAALEHQPGCACPDSHRSDNRRPLEPRHTEQWHPGQWPDQRRDVDLARWPGSRL